MKPMKPNDLGKILLVEECQKVEINSFLRRTKLKLKETILNSEISTLGTVIELTTSKTGLGGTRYWFKCPLCKGRVGTLFIHAVSQNLGCRGCLGLQYRKIRYKGMVENLVG
jgi:hypothetical protein